MDTAPTSIDPRYYNLTSREAAQLVGQDLGIRFTPQNLTRLRWAGRSPPCFKKLGRFYFEKHSTLAWSRSQISLIAHDDCHRERVA
jgi:hypothetical protein